MFLKMEVFGVRRQILEDKNWARKFDRFRNKVGCQMVKALYVGDLDLNSFDCALHFLDDHPIEVCLRSTLNRASYDLIKWLGSTLRQRCPQWRPSVDLLFIPARYGRIEQMKLLIDSHLSKVEVGGTLAMRRYEHVDAVQFLIDAGVMHRSQRNDSK